MGGESVGQRRCRIDGCVGYHQRQGRPDAPVTHRDGAHRDERRNRNRETRVARLLARRRDTNRKKTKHSIQRKGYDVGVMISESIILGKLNDRSSSTAGLCVESVI